VTETEGRIPNDFYGEERLIECFSKNLTLSAESLCDVLQSDLIEFSGTTQLTDDRAVVVIKCTDD
jgi:serine phosphatase RsbU (regulator of sigma subunit)